jgi:hypothetical protein
VLGHYSPPRWSAVGSARIRVFALFQEQRGACGDRASHSVLEHESAPPNPRPRPTCGEKQVAGGPLYLLIGAAPRRWSPVTNTSAACSGPTPCGAPDQSAI